MMVLIYYINSLLTLSNYLQILFIWDHYENILAAYIYGLVKSLQALVTVVKMQWQLYWLLVKSTQVLTWVKAKQDAPWRNMWRTGWKNSA